MAAERHKSLLLINYANEDGVEIHTALNDKIINLVCIIYITIHQCRGLWWLLFINDQKHVKIMKFARILSVLILILCNPPQSRRRREFFSLALMKYFREEKTPK